jgi:hypothetical protein
MVGSKSPLGYSNSPFTLRSKLRRLLAPPAGHGSLLSRMEMMSDPSKSRRRDDPSPQDDRTACLGRWLSTLIEPCGCEATLEERCLAGLKSRDREGPTRIESRVPGGYKVCYASPFPSFAHLGESELREPPSCSQFTRNELRCSHCSEQTRRRWTRRTAVFPFLD